MGSEPPAETRQAQQTSGWKDISHSLKSLQIREGRKKGRRCLRNTVLRSPSVLYLTLHCGLLPGLAAPVLGGSECCRHGDRAEEAGTSGWGPAAPGRVLRPAPSAASPGAAPGQNRPGPAGVCGRAAPELTPEVSWSGDRLLRDGQH